MSPSLHSTLRVLFALPLLVLPLGCSQGGSVKTPGTSVPLIDIHHLFALSTLPAFTKFPVPASEVLPLYGTISFGKKSTYSVSLNNNNTGKDSYALDKDGKLSIYVTPANRAKIRYLGAYGLDGDTGLFHFCDRYATSNGSGIALFWGAKVAQGMPVLAGDWHLLSLHYIFPSSNVLDPDNIGRAVGGGAITIDSAGAITNLQNGVESTTSTISFGGTASAFADGSVTLDIDYTNAQNQTDTRSFKAAAGVDGIVGVDPDSGDGEVGLIALIKKRSGPIDPMALAGTYRIGLYTIFVDVQRPGSDAAVGTITFNNTNGFSLDATGASGQGFTYSGTYAADPNVDGGLILTVPGTKETWHAAVDEGYHTVAVIDDFVEQRSGTKPPELNIGLAHREAP